MATVVMKFGGASVASTAHFSRISKIILDSHKRYDSVAVVVSAMGGNTDQLIRLAGEVHPSPPRREMDMLISVGERISIALLAMALDLEGHTAISFTGSQSGIITCGRHTDARILEVKPHRLKAHLDSGKTVIVAGFQGVSREGQITTLGRGGSDTSAVALGLALNADIVEFYKDVPGVFSEDPKKNPSAAHFQHLSYDQALGIVEQGAKILHPRSVALAQKNGMPLFVRSFLGEGEGTLIRDEGAVRAVPPQYEEPE